MQTIAGADAYFLAEESPNRHMHTLKLAIIDPSSAYRPLTFKLFRELCMRQLPQFEAFRRRPIKSLMLFGPPLWVEDQNFDMSYHIRHVVLPEPGRDEELDEIMSEIMSLPLRSDHPLWQLFFIEGLEGGRIAYLIKIHHAVADGAASALLLSLSFQTTPEPISEPLPAIEVARRFQPERVPATHLLLLTTMQRGWAAARKIPALLGRAVRSVGVDIKRTARGVKLPVLPFGCPPSRFNKPVHARRIVTHVSLPLSDLRTVKKAFGCSINTVYLALIGGALRRYLEGHGELPERPLSAAVPVSVRTAQNTTPFGNALSQWFASTGSHIADPVERLEHVMESTRAARDSFAAKDPQLNGDWLDVWPLRRLYLVLLPTVLGAILGRPSYNIIASNVPGPREPLYSDGALLLRILSIGPLTREQGINFTAWSYLDDFAITIQACHEYAPDLRRLGAAIAPELKELLEAVEREQARSQE